jgi:heme exporter protein B
MILLQRDVLLAFRDLGMIITPLAFFLLAVTIFPLAISADPYILRRIAPGVIWSMALLSALLPQEAIFLRDAEDGTLEQLMLLPQPLLLLVLAKVLMHWLAFGVPLLVLAPVLGAWMQMSSDELLMLLLTLPLGTGVFSLLATFSAALLVGVRGSHFLGALIALPLCLPTIIFASAAISSDTAAPLLLLAALFTGSLTLLPFAIVGALNQYQGGG